MSIKIEEVGERLLYSCNCGWIDTGHALPGGAQFLWDQILNGGGQISRKSGANGFKVTYREEMGKKIFGYMLRKGVTKKYFIRNNLSPIQRESVALAIFAEVSDAFENYQDSIEVLWWTSDSSFSQEDLISDLIGFYSVVRPGIDYKKLCNIQDAHESIEVFNMMSQDQRDAKSKSYDSPKFYKCKKCPSGKFPDELKSIELAVKDGKDPLFRDWTDEDTYGPLLPLVRALIVAQQNYPQGHAKALALSEGLPKIRSQAMAGKNVKG